MFGMSADRPLSYDPEHISYESYALKQLPATIYAVLASSCGGFGAAHVPSWRCLG